MKTTLKTLGLTLFALSASIVSAHNGVDHTVAVSATANVNIDATMRPPTTTGSVNASVQVRDNVKSNIQQRTANRFAKMLIRYGATIHRETTIMARINSRIQKIKANGGNTTEAEKLTASAKAHLDLANASLATLTLEANAQAALENASTTVQKLRDGIVEMRKTAVEIEKQLRAAHQDLLKCVGILRGMSQVNANAETNVNTQPDLIRPTPNTMVHTSDEMNM